MTHYLRLAAALAAAVLTLTACFAPSGGKDDEEPEVEGCGDCTAEIAGLKQQLEGLEHVSAVSTVRRVADSPTNAAGVTIELESSSATDTGLVDEALRLVWESRIHPVDNVRVRVELANGELITPVAFSFREGQDHDFYAEQWGPRPVD